MAHEHPLTVAGAPELRATAADTADVLSVEPVVRQLNAVCKQATLQFSLSVGELLVRSLYSGDIGCLRSRDRKQDAALRKVATHPDLAMSASMLYGCVAIYELCERLGIRSWKHVSTSHLRLVLPLDPDEQTRLLDTAETNRWPVRRLEDEVVALTKGRARTPGRGGRKRRSRLRGRIHDLEMSIDAITSSLQVADPAEEPSPESTRAAIEVLRRASDLCTALEKRVALNEVAFASEQALTTATHERTAMADKTPS